MTVTLEPRTGAPVLPPLPPLPDEPTGTPHRTRRVPRLDVAMVLLVVVGAGFRLWGLGAHRLGYDEAFTAMAGRLPLANLVPYLRVHDSHPPLDYLLRAPLSSAGVNELLIRLPSALCSIAALALFAWWMSRYKLPGLIAVALLAISAFQITHGRTARMYAELELLGVGAAVLSYAWLRRPRRWHALAVGLIVFLGLLTHVSVFLLGAGLFLLAGIRRDRAAWAWRGAIAAGGLGWAVLWGPSFLVQTRGGHSDWIPRTTFDGVIHTVGRLVTYQPELHAVVLLAVIAGGLVLWHRDRTLGMVWSCVGVAPIVLAAIAGTGAPVLIDRTLTVVAWGPVLAIAMLLGALAGRSKVLGAVAVVAVVAISVPAAAHVVTTPSGPDVALRHLEQVVAPGDVVATRPSGKLPEIAWSIGVRGPLPFHAIPVRGLGHTLGFQLGNGPASGRTWLLDWSSKPLPARAANQCAPAWAHHGSRVLCVR